MIYCLVTAAWCLLRVRPPSSRVSVSYSQAVPAPTKYTSIHSAKVICGDRSHSKNVRDWIIINSPVVNFHKEIMSDIFSNYNKISIPTTYIEEIHLFALWCEVNLIINNSSHIYLNIVNYIGLAGCEYKSMCNLSFFQEFPAQFTINYLLLNTTTSPKE